MESSVKIIGLLAVVLVSAVKTQDSEYAPNIHFPHVPDLTRNNGNANMNGEEHDIHHGSTHVQYQGTSRNEPYVVTYTTHHPVAHTYNVTPQDSQMTNHAISQASHTYYYPEETKVQSTTTQIKPSMSDLGWKPIIGSPQWVPISKPGPILPPMFWKNMNMNYPPKKYMPYKTAPQKYSGPKHHAVKPMMMVHRPKFVPVPLAEHNIMIDIPHPFKIPETKHEFVHIPHDQLQKYLQGLGNIKTDSQFHY